MNRREFLHCHTCNHCYSYESRDMVKVNVSLCDKFHWPTYKMDCPHYEQSKMWDGHHNESYLRELAILEKQECQSIK